MTDTFARFKQSQKEAWAHFAPLEIQTMMPAAQLVRHARVREGQRVLDCACGTGVVSITAARLGARVTGLDLTPELLERARENSRLSGLEVEWREGDVEEMPFDDSAFDVVLSQFGHMFAPRPDVAIGEMLRVLRPGGTIAFSTWPPELLVARRFALVARYLPPPAGVAPPPLWGDPNIVRERLGSNVRDVVFDRGRMVVPALSVQHHNAYVERAGGPIVKVVEMLSATDPAKLAEFRRESEAMVAEYFEDNIVRQDYLMTRAAKN